MGKKHIIVTALILVIGVLSIFLYIKLKPEPIWEVNEKRLFEALEANPELNGKRISTEKFVQLMPFEWDTVYSFPPYYPQDKAAQAIGIPEFPVLESVNEGTNQTFFMNKGQVVCYVYGYPEHSGLYIGFGPSSIDEDYKVILKRSDMLEGTVKLERTDSGIWFLMIYSTL